MTFKVYYQPTKTATPRRENTHVLYMEADSEAEARQTVENKTEYSIEFIELLDEKSLEFEKKDPNFKMTKF
ncbi:DNA-directed RNA polymerase subunit epsilon [Limosilactobacillus sp.]|uniref:DNA-directed RNA polymerase subunit epsilon n=1 Tax=Limosilactobacillus sp. TaxID=2773925 RepID=UPI00345EB146